jgi:5S rRNA maturation endonuclease (ribonuclease M5)
MIPAESWDMIRAVRDGQQSPRGESETIDKRGRVYQAFGTFLADFVRDLNNRSEEGWSLLVEGIRDQKALRRLGYDGSLVTVSLMGRNGAGALRGARKVVILTDLDREGTVLASKFVESLNHERIETSLSERRRLKAASRGVFLHIENLSRFARPEASRWEPSAGNSPPRPGRPYREGLRRFRRREAAG